MIFKNKFKIITYILGITCLTTVFIPAVGGNASELASKNLTEISSKKDFNPQNSEAVKLYNQLNNKKAKNKQSYNKNIALSESNSLDLTGDFSVLNQTSKDNSKEIVYSSETDSLSNVISYDKDTNIYSLLEANNDTGEVLYIVDNVPFKLKYEGADLNLYSENGEVLPLIITEYQDTLASDKDFVNKIPVANSQAAVYAATWGTEYGPMYKTNKVLVDVLSDISLYTAYIRHPIFGVISVISASLSAASNKMYCTLWIKYYQSLEVGNTTHVRERDDYYQYNNYTGYVGTNTIYFYTTRPY